MSPRDKRASCFKLHWLAGLTDCCLSLSFASLSGPPCRDFLKGLCTRGDACRYHHYDAASLPPCRDFQRGRCERINDCKYAHDRNDATAAMHNGVPSYQGEQNGQHSSTGFAAPGAYAGGQYGTAGAAVSGYGSGYAGGYAAAAAPGTDGYDPAAAPADGTAPSESAGSPVKMAASGDDSYTQSASGRKRGRADDEAEPAPGDLSADAAQPEEDGGERPAKLQKASHEENPETVKVDGTDDHSSSLLSSATRGADGKALDAATGVEGIEGGPDPASLAGGQVGPGPDGGLINAGNVSVDSAPSDGSGPSGLGSAGGAAGGPA